MLTLCPAAQLQIGNKIATIVVEGIEDIHCSAVISLLDTCFCDAELLEDTWK